MLTFCSKLMLKFLQNHGIIMDQQFRANYWKNHGTKEKIVAQFWTRFSIVHANYLQIVACDRKIVV